MITVGDLLHTCMYVYTQCFRLLVTDIITSSLLETHSAFTWTWRLSRMSKHIKNPFINYCNMIAKWHKSIRNRHCYLIFLCLPSIFSLVTTHSNRAHSVYKALTHVQLQHGTKVCDDTTAHYVEYLPHTLENLWKPKPRVGTEESWQIFESTVRIICASANFVNNIRHQDLNQWIIRAQMGEAVNLKVQATRYSKKVTTKTKNYLFSRVPCCNQRNLKFHCHSKLSL